MTGVQLIGKKAVLTRFEKFDADSWALYQGKQFIVGGVGSDVLDEWLSDFDAAGSTATYTLRMYDLDAAPTSSTGGDYMACVNFKLNDAYEGYGIAGHSNKLMERIGALEKQLKDQEEEGDNSNDLNSIIMGWLNDPVKLGQVAGAIRQMMGGAGSQLQPALISGAPMQTVSGFDDNDAKLARIAAALDKLEKRDPKLIEHLEKLAQLSQTDTLLFKAVISKLDAL